MFTLEFTNNTLLAEFYSKLILDQNSYLYNIFLPESIHSGLINFGKFKTHFI